MFIIQEKSCAAVAFYASFLHNRELLAVYFEYEKKKMLDFGCNIVRDFLDFCFLKFVRCLLTPAGEHIICMMMVVMLMIMAAAGAVLIVLMMMLMFLLMVVIMVTVLVMVMMMVLMLFLMVVIMMTMPVMIMIVVMMLMFFLVMSMACFRQRLHLQIILSLHGL